jgi:UDP-N-acetylglucosamine 2-epimerase
VDKVSILKGIEHFRSFAPDDLQINLYGDGDAGRRIVKTLSNLTG